MPALGFLARFADAVESGEKRQTIRRVRKHPIKPGDKLYLKTGMRTNHCRALGLVTCASITPVRLGSGPFATRVELDGRLLSITEAPALARADGFAGIEEMLRWFYGQYSLPFDGVLIRW